jgi:DHA2 family multidrug resistance protein
MSGPAGASHTAWHAPHNPWLIAVVATLATFMEVLDTSIANVALPHIAGNLGASTADSTWVLTSYLVANALVLPATPFISAIIGRRAYYMVSVCGFTVASLLCGLSPGLPTLVACRLLQGLAGGALQPLTQAILVDTFRPEQRGMGMAVYGMTVVVAPVIGPTLGGWITDDYDWRWIFLINVPIGAIALLLCARFITDPPFLRRRTGPGRWRADFVGLSLIALGLGALQLALDLGEREDWFDSPWITGAMIGSGVALVAGVFWSLHHRDPMVDVRMLRERNLALSCLHMLVFGGVLFGSTALLPLFMQTQLGYDSRLSGMALSPGGMVVAVLMPIVGFAVSRWDPRALVVGGVVVVAGSLWWLGQFSLEVDFRTIVHVRMLQGLGLAFLFVPINTIAYARVAAAARNSASSLVNIARNIGGSVGISVATALIVRGTQAHRAMLSAHTTPYDPEFVAASQRLAALAATAGGDPVRADAVAAGVLSQTLDRQAAMLAYIDVFRLLAVTFLLLVPVVLLMRRRPPARHVELAIE